MLGVFSYFVDSMGGSEAHAMPSASNGTAGSSGSGYRSSSGSGFRSTSSAIRQHERWLKHREAVERTLAPLASVMAPCIFAADEGRGAPAGGCRVTP